jgi:hypothetical protein
MARNGATKVAQHSKSKRPKSANAGLGLLLPHDDAGRVSQIIDAVCHLVVHAVGRRAVRDAVDGVPPIAGDEAADHTRTCVAASAGAFLPV